MDTTLLRNLESSHDWRIYVQNLKEWNKNNHMEKDNQIQFTALFKITRRFKKFSPVTKILTKQNAHWQIDTIEKHFQRGSTLREIRKTIKLNQSYQCPNCPDKNHTRGECLIAKQKARQRRLDLSQNNRKDNQTGYYANRIPFQLLTGTLIPQEVFEIYDREFVPFYSRQNIQTLH